MLAYTGLYFRILGGETPMPIAIGANKVTNQLTTAIEAIQQLTTATEARTTAVAEVTSETSAEEAETTPTPTPTPTPEKRSFRAAAISAAATTKAAGEWAVRTVAAAETRLPLARSVTIGIFTQLLGDRLLQHSTNGYAKPNTDISTSEIEGKTIALYFS